MPQETIWTPIITTLVAISAVLILLLVNRWLDRRPLKRGRKFEPLPRVTPGKKCRRG